MDLPAFQNKIDGLGTPIALTLSGSHAYGLNGPTSDLDYRGIFVFTNPDYILGLSKHDEIHINDQDDIVLRELRTFLALCKKGNTEPLEILFCAQDKFIFLHNIFKHVRSFSHNLLCPVNFSKSVLGYAQSERRLALGERKGTIGGKRYEQVQQFGYSPKNFVNLLRILLMACILFEEEQFIVDFSDRKEWQMLFRSIKFEPQKHTAQELLELSVDFERRLKSVCDKKIDFRWDNKVANKILHDIYIDFL